MDLKTVPFALAWFLVPLTALAQGRETGDTADGVFKADGTVIVTNNGFAPIPAFSFEKPTVTAFLAFDGGGFAYQPDVALGLDGDLWMTNYWLRYDFAETGRFGFRGGINLSLFFRHETTDSQGEIIQANRNVTFETAGYSRVSERLVVGLTYQYNHAVDHGTISGHLIDLSGDVFDIGVTDDVALNLGPRIFYFDHVGNMDGLFAAIHISIGHEHAPISIFSQGVRRMWSNFSPSPVFQWNTGVQYVFK